MLVVFPKPDILREFSLPIQVAREGDKVFLSMAPYGRLVRCSEEDLEKIPAEARELQYTVDDEDVANFIATNSPGLLSARLSMKAMTSGGRGFFPILVELRDWGPELSGTWQPEIKGEN